MNFDFLDQSFFGNTLLNLLLFAVILVFGLIFKRLISRLLSKLLFKLFEKIHTDTDSTTFSAFLIRPVEFLLLIIILYSAVNQLDFPLHQVIFRRDDYELKLIHAVDKLFLLAFIVGFFWMLLRIMDFVSHIFSYKASKTASKSDDQLVPFLRELAKILTIIVAIFVIMGSVFNMNVATIIAGLGIGGIAVALAAQDSLQNLIGSFAIFADKPFHVGDYIKIEGIEGTVEKVGFRSTHIRTLEKTIVVIPNKKMVDTPLENVSRRSFFRVRFELGLDTSTTNEQMVAISKQIKEFINSHEEVSQDTIVNFDSFGTAMVNIQVIYHIHALDGLDVVKLKEDIYYRVRQIVSENEASFADPAQTLYARKPPLK